MAYPYFPKHEMTKLRGITLFYLIEKKVISYIIKDERYSV